MSSGFRIMVSLLLLALSTAALVCAWSPLLVTHVPLEQGADIPLQYADLVEGYLSARLGSYSRSLSIATILILINLLVSFLVIWSPKWRANQNT